MENNELNLHSVRDFLIEDVFVDQLVEDLNDLYSEYTEAVMHASALKGEPVTEDQIMARYTIWKLKEVFKKVEKDNEKK